MRNFQIFTAGVGELSDIIRAKILEGLENLGIKYDPEKNRLARTRNAELDISENNSPVKIFIIPTDEELVFVEDVVALLEGTYDLHTNFRYTFQDPDYKNLMRENSFEKECKENPDLVKIQANINNK